MLNFFMPQTMAGGADVVCRFRYKPLLPAN